MENKRIIISEDLFRMIYQYFLCNRSDLREDICNGLVEKMEKRIDRDLYTKSLTAITDEEKEANRKAYLDRKGIPEDFRW